MVKGPRIYKLDCEKNVLHVYILLQGQQAEGATEEMSTSRKKKRANYNYIPTDVRKKVVAYAVQYGTRPAGRLFNISEGTIRSWKQKGFDNPAPVAPRGRKVTYGKELDEELRQMLVTMRSQGQSITIERFSEYAKKIIDERRPELNFKCSRGWVEKFFKRHNLSMSSKASSSKQTDMAESKKELDNSTECGVEYQNEIELSDANDDPSNFILDSRNGSDFPVNRKRRRTNEGSSSSSSMNATFPNMASNSFNSDDASSAESNHIKLEANVNSQHVMKIIEKLDSSATPDGRKFYDTQQRMEVVDHAKMYGSRSAERKFGVPETTIRFWLRSSASNSTPPDCKPNILEASLSTDGGLDALRRDSTESNFQCATATENTTSSSGELEAALLAWCLERRAQGEALTFDGLCDQALAFISRENPSSAYSSTRRWVDSFLNMKIRDVLNVAD